MDKTLQLAIAETLHPPKEKEKDDVDGFVIMIASSLRKLPHEIRLGLYLKLMNIVDTEVKKHNANTLQQDPEQN